MKLCSGVPSSLLIPMAIWGHCAVAEVWYVDKVSSIQIPDGAAWETAFSTIQPAIDAAHAAGGGEVWVAAGVYDEYRVYDGPISLDTGALHVKEAVDLYGGFTGNETNRDERDPAANVTVIDGSQSYYGHPSAGVVVLETDGVFDGFTVRGGVTPEAVAAAGISSLLFGPTIANCIIENNVAGGNGAGYFGGLGSASLYNCVFRNNSAGSDGGGLIYYNFDGPPIRIENCTFESNTAMKDGGGIAIFGTSEIINCKFINNRANAGDVGDGGGGVYARGAVTVVNGLFHGNSAVLGGALLAGTDQSGPGLETGSLLIHCTLAGNAAPSGGAFATSGVRLGILNSIFWDNGIVPISEGIQPSLVAASNSTFDLDTSTNILESGTGNIAAIPEFVAPARNDFRLLATSSGVDSGAAESLFEFGQEAPLYAAAPSADLDAAARPVSGAYDRGAYEHNPALYVDPYDLNEDQLTNAIDVQLVINAALGLDAGCTCDSNRDESINAQDIQITINAALGIR